MEFTSDTFPAPARSAGLNRLNDFVINAGVNYTKARNYDFGPDRRDNVSLLSPYVRHRLVLEQELLAAVLAQHSRTAANKFVQEVFWRAYFKGWLEQHPDVWTDYRTSLTALLGKLATDDKLLDRYTAATEGRTGIECFDTWVKELIEFGYLHNHARMWFASIWVFTLELPWQLGADFFYRHLVDGDPASNTLSWRWVCGLHTRGKTYLARVSNIASYTDRRFCPHGQLATEAPALSESRVFPLRPLRMPQILPPKERFGLLITEEDTSPASLLAGRAPVRVLGALATRMRSPLPIGDAAGCFAEGAVNDAVGRVTRTFGVSGELTSSYDWANTLAEWAAAHRLKTIATAYAPVGPVAEMLAAAARRLERNGIRLVQLRRTYDSVTWPHAQRGFFKLKENIPAILDRLAIGTGDDQLGSEAV